MTDNHNEQIDGLMNQAKRFAAEMQLDQATSACRQVLAVDPTHKLATVLLAQIAFQRNQPSDAQTLLQSAIDQDPADPYLYAHLSQVLIRLGKAENALESYNHALSLKPDFVDARIALGNLLIMMGRYRDAISEYQQVLLVRDDHAPVFYNLAIAQAANGDNFDALKSYEQAISLKPDYDAAYFNMANLKRSLGDVVGAVGNYRQAAHLVPQQRLYWQQFANSLRALDTYDFDDTWETDILRCLRTDGIEHRGLARHVAALTMRKYIPSNLRDSEPSSRRQTLLDAVHSNALSILYSFEPLRIALKMSLFNEVDFEKFLIDLRYALLNAWSVERAAIEMEDDLVSFIAALAQQCFLNEYVYYQEQEEQYLVDSLRSRIETALDSDDQVSDGEIALLSCYKPLNTVLNEQILSAQASLPWRPAIAELITLQVREPYHEKILAIDLPTITSADKSSDDPVRLQYEDNPYPRWIGLPFTIPRPAGDVLGQQFPHLLRGDVKFSAAPRLLVAGCGTGRDAMMTAMRFMGSSVLAIDISRTSLAFAVRNSRKLGMNNIEFGVADVMQLNDSVGQFDLIEAVGILHHLPDPVTGWRRLLNHLRPGGFMKVGLYSSLGRSPIRAAQDLAKKWRLGSSPADIRLFRKKILRLDPDTEAHEITRYTDFFSMSGCRDLVFHEREHWYTVPDIEEMLEDLGLTFVGFELEDPAYLRAYKTRNPDDPDAVALHNWHEFELEHPRIFASMYQFWVKRS